MKPELEALICFRTQALNNHQIKTGKKDIGKKEKKKDLKVINKEGGNRK